MCYELFDPRVLHDISHYPLGKMSPKRLGFGENCSDMSRSTTVDRANLIGKGNPCGLFGTIENHLKRVTFDIRSDGTGKAEDS